MLSTASTSTHMFKTIRAIAFRISVPNIKLFFQLKWRIYWWSIYFEM